MTVDWGPQAPGVMSHAHPTMAQAIELRLQMEVPDWPCVCQSQASDRIASSSFRIHVYRLSSLQGAPPRELSRPAPR